MSVGFGVFRVWGLVSHNRVQGSGFRVEIMGPGLRLCASGFGFPGLILAQSDPLTLDPEP